MMALWPALAFAEGGGVSQDTFQAILVLIGLATIAFITTHFIVEWLQRTYGIVSGVEYIVIGAIFSPSFVEFAGVGWQLLTPERLVKLSPALVLGEGSLGLLAGVILNFRARDGVTKRAFGIGLVLTLATLLMVSGVPFAAGAYFVGLDAMWQYLPHVLCFGAIASVASGAPLRTLIAFLDARGEGANLVTRVARSCSSFAVIAFGVIFCLVQPASDLVPGFDFGPVADVFFWLGVHIIFGVLLGIVFALFLMQDVEDDKVLTIVIGMVIFTSGVGYFLKLSPILVCFVLGVVFANISNRGSEQVQRMLLSVEQPLYMMIYFFLGASMSLSVPWWAWAAAIPYMLLRGAGRGLGGVVARASSNELRHVPPIGAALLAPGALSAAMLLNFQEVFEGQPFVAETYAALLLAIVVSEPLAHRFSRRWLIDGTDVALTREGTT